MKKEGSSALVVEDTEGDWLALWSCDRARSACSEGVSRPPDGDSAFFSTEWRALARVREISDELVAPDRAAFRVTGTFPDGRQIIWRTMIWTDGGRATRQVDVEAWGPEP